MTDVAPKTYADFTLPAAVVSKVDLSHLVEELERLDNDLTSADVRTKSGAAPAAQPVISQQLTTFIADNQLLVTESRARMELITQMRILKDKAPIIHMTFAVEADAASLQQIALWLRQEIDPHAVVAVGLQPGLVAGVYLRTPNHVHDLSLRGKLAEQRAVLSQELGALRGNR